MKKWVLRDNEGRGLTDSLLFNRGIKTAEGAEKFFNPDYEAGLADSFGMLGMDKAVERILRAIKGSERIVVFGDYDADGVCASAIFCEFFKKIGFENYHIHIPNRYSEGYGLTLEAIDEFAGKGNIDGSEPRAKANLIVTLDCGITDVEETEKANKEGIDVVIIDHHLAQEKLPAAYAIVDPKQNGDKYLFKDFCGAGLAFKTVCALIQKGDFKVVPGWGKWLLDLVAIATVADMVSLTGENRVLTSFGLKVLKKTQRVGLKALCRRSNLNIVNVTEDDIGFTIAPRINTASRMGHANTSFNLLVTESAGEADWISGHLDEMNVERKAAVEEVLVEIEKRISVSRNLPRSAGVVFEGDEKWFVGVLGIVANRLMDKYHCPVFVWGKAESKIARGSCRTADLIHFVEFMNKIPAGLLIEFGGHAAAGGFAIVEGKADELKKTIEEEIKKEFDGKEASDSGAILYLDAELDINAVNWNFYSTIEKFQPFGKDNEKPVFLFKNLPIDKIKKFGNGGIHLQLDFKLRSNLSRVMSRDKTISAIGFFIAEAEKFVNLAVGQKIDLAATLEKSTFRATPELRLRIVDVRASD